MPKVKAIHQLVIDGVVYEPGKIVDVSAEDKKRFMELNAVYPVGKDVEEPESDEPVVEEPVVEATEDKAAEKPAKSTKSSKKNDDLV